MFGTGDWSIEFKLEVTGGRYGAGKSSYSLKTIDTSNFGDSRESAEFDLSSIVPTGSPQQDPILQGADEVASIAIVIKKDSSGVAATPTIRSFSAFI